MNVLAWLFYVTFFRIMPVLKHKLVQLYGMLPPLSLNRLKNLVPKRRISESDSDDSISHEIREKSKTPVGIGVFPISTPKRMTDDEYLDMCRTPEPSVAQSRATTPIPHFPRAMSPALHRVKSDLHLERSATPFFNQQNRIQCQGTTAKGTQCKNAAQPGYDHCRIHQPR